jgi:hypothetical protein
MEWAPATQASKKRKKHLFASITMSYVGWLVAGGCGVDTHFRQLSGPGNSGATTDRTGSSSDILGLNWNRKPDHAWTQQGGIDWTGMARASFG